MNKNKFTICWVREGNTETELVNHDDIKLLYEEPPVPYRTFSRGTYFTETYGETPVYAKFAEDARRDWTKRFPETRILDISF